MNLLSERLRWAMDHFSEVNGADVRPADVARAAKVSGATLNYWLTGVNGMSAAKARMVAAFLGVDPMWLETGKGDPKANATSIQPAAAETQRAARMILAYDDEERLLDLYRRADKPGQRVILGTAEYEASLAARTTASADK